MTSNDDLVKEIDKLGTMLERESSFSLDLIKQILNNLDQDNLISFFDIIIYDKPKRNRWKTPSIKLLTEQLRRIGVIKDDKLLKQLQSSSEMSQFLIISAMERVAELLEKFTKNFLRMFWQTENNICQECGNVTTSDSLFCNKCGNKIENQSWDVGINELTAEIGKKIIGKMSDRIYYFQNDPEMHLIYGCFYNNGLSDKDERFLIGSLRALKFNVRSTTDRIYFERRLSNGGSESEKISESLQGIAKHLKFEKVENEAQVKG